MIKKFAVIIIIVVALFLSACQAGAASTAPTLTPKKGKQPILQASATAGDMNPVAEAATLTAIATMGTPTQDAFAIPGDETTTSIPSLDQPTLDPNLPTPTNGGPSLATVTPIPVQTTAPGVHPTTYTLQEGEFIFCLARRFNVDPAETLALNGLVDSETIYAGRTITLPSSGVFPGPRALKAHPATYTVSSSNDSIYAIACLYGDVDPMNIAAVNNLSAPYNLTAGMQLQIP